VLSALRSKTKENKSTQFSVAVLANPVFDADDDRFKQTRSTPTAVATNSNNSNKRVLRSGLKLVPLPATEKEASDISAAVPASGRKEIATGFEASRATVMKLQNEGYRIIHFATHGDLDTEHPELSSIVLSLFDADKRPQDGFLRLNDIYNLKLPAELIVLSGCRTGLGGAIKGEGLIGLTRGFMYAGSPRVVASLWQIEDLGTSELMKRFYHHMASDGMAPALALRQAQVDLLRSKRWKSPYYWSGFVIQGEWKAFR
jgi:CHAT domain-containing protein